MTEVPGPEDYNEQFQVLQQLKFFKYLSENQTSESRESPPMRNSSK